MTQPTLWQPSDIVSAEAGGEAETPKRRGRIPQSAWPHILERHRAGATLSAIAREFDCTPSAISYIVRKAEAAGITPSEAGAPTPQGAPPTEGEAPAQAAAPPAAGSPAADTPTTDTPTTDTPATNAPAADTPAAGSPAGPPDEAPQAQPSAGTAEAAATRTEEAAPQPRREESPAEPSLARPRESGRREGRRDMRGESRTLRAAPKREEGTGRPAEPARATSQTQSSAPQPAIPQPVAGAAPAQPPASALAPGQGQAQASAAGRSEPVDAIEGRLRDTARSCLVAYRGWRTQPGEQTIQTLSEALHDLRKALARIEIDMSASRRDEQAQRPIPIPAHRASRRPR